MSKSRKYFIQQFLQEKYNHGGIGPVHAEKILLKNGYRPIFFPGHHSNSLFSKFSRLYYLLRIFNSIKHGSVVIFLFPVYATMNNILLKWLAGKKGITCVCFIADIDGIKDAEENLMEKEKQVLRQFSHFIVHNEKMKQWVSQNISAEARIAELEFFDFITKPVMKDRAISKEIVFAGNLEKSGFLKNLPLVITAQPSLKFNLYGPGMFSMDESYKHVYFHGVFSPEELPEKIEGSFGLVWDGDSVERPSGILGHYLQFITHHKVSLYIIAGLPIIIPSSAGSAPLVLRYGIGIIADSLFDIEKKIDALTEEQYQSMRSNMRRLAERISKGECLPEAIEKLGV